MKKAGITGGTGFVGRHLTKLLINNGYNVIIFTRNPEKHQSNNHLQYAAWDPTREKIDTEALKKLDAVIHLAGAGIADKRWTDKRKKQILDSRVQGTTFLVDQLKQYAPQCKTFISSSAIGCYGPDRGGEPFTEDDPSYNDFLANVCMQWEAASKPVEEVTRRVVFRNGIVLGADGGAYPEFARAVPFYIKPLFGRGRQIMSWIHIDDLCGMMLYALEHPEMGGVYNAVAPIPVTQKLLMSTIGYKMDRVGLGIPIPALVLKIALGEMSGELLKSATVSDAKILSAGYHFQYKTIGPAIEEIVSNGKHNH